METKRATVHLDVATRKQEIIFNGIPQMQTILNYNAVCGNCNTILVAFEPQHQFKEIAPFLQNDISKKIKYCSTCGCKLNYNFEIIDLPKESIVEVKKD